MSGARVAVVGGGIFGATAAVRLARHGHSVVLFERARELLFGASRANQRRLHRGYHYPRGMKTATEALHSSRAFEDEYRSAIHNGYAHYVAIARQGSLVSAERYVAFCEEAGLRYREEYPSILRRSSVDLSLRIDEALIDVNELRRLCAVKLASAGVDVRLRTPADHRTLADFDQVVLATYTALNDLYPGAVAEQRYQYEICEKPLVRLPAAYRGTSLVVMDGPFMCLDPVAGTDTFLLGNVDHAIHASTVGPFPLTPRALFRSVDSGLVPCPPVSRAPQFLTAGREFLRCFSRARHLGSYFTTRTVLPNLEATDDRPTVVRRVDERTITLFGGKITTCVVAAHELAGQLPCPSPIPAL